MWTVWPTTIVRVRKDFLVSVPKLSIHASTGRVVFSEDEGKDGVPPCCLNAVYFCDRQHPAEMHESKTLRVHRK